MALRDTANVAQLVDQKPDGFTNLARLVAALDQAVIANQWFVVCFLFPDMSSLFAADAADWALAKLDAAVRFDLGSPLIR